jgi:hypothetical protein
MLKACMTIDFFLHSLPFEVHRPMVDMQPTSVPCLQEKGVC